MNVIKSETGSLTASVKIEIAVDDYKGIVAQSLKDYQKKANMPGFRPGKVPFGMIKKMYGTSVLVEEVNKLVSDSISNYLIENKIEILGSPLPDMEKNADNDFEVEGDYSFSFDIALQPELEVVLDKKVKVEYSKIVVDEEMASKYVVDMRKRLGNYTDPTEVGEEDVLNGDFAELDNGDIKEGGVVNTSSISPQYIKLKTVMNKMIGMKVGDSVDFNPLKATKNEAESAAMLGVKKEELTNIKSDFRFTLKKITRIEMAEMNEEFFDKVMPGKEVKTEEDFVSAIKEELSKQFSPESDRKFLNDVSETLIKDVKFELPEEFLRKWLKDNKKEDITDDQIDDEFEKYTNSIRWQLIENNIVTKEEVKIQPDEIKAHVRNLMINQFRMSGMTDTSMIDERLDEITANVMKNEEEFKKIQGQLIDEKMIVLFKEKIKITEKEMSYDDFIMKSTEAVK